MTLLGVWYGGDEAPDLTLDHWHVWAWLTDTASLRAYTGRGQTYLAADALTRAIESARKDRDDPGWRWRQSTPTQEQ